MSRLSIIQRAIENAGAGDDVRSLAVIEGGVRVRFRLWADLSNVATSVGAELDEVLFERGITASVVAFDTGLHVATFYWDDDESAEVDKAAAVIVLAGTAITIGALVINALRRIDWRPPRWVVRRVALPRVRR